LLLIFCCGEVVSLSEEVAWTYEGVWFGGVLVFCVGC